MVFQADIGSTYFDTVTCLSVNQDSRLVAFGHRDGRVDCFAFLLPAADDDDGDRQPLAGVVSLELDPSLSRPRSRARLSTVQILACGGSDVDNQSEDSVLLCGYTNGRIEMVMRSGGGEATTTTTTTTKKFCLEEGSTVAWVRGERDQILCACRSLVALSSESLHILVQPPPTRRLIAADSPPLTGWSTRSVRARAPPVTWTGGGSAACSGPARAPSSPRTRRGRPTAWSSPLPRVRCAEQARCAK